MNDLERSTARLHSLVSTAMRDRPPAHDLSHVERVVTLAKEIASREGARAEIVVPAALLHELVNLPKHHPDSHRSGDLCAIEARRALASEGWEPSTADAIAACIRDHAFSKGATATTIEARVLQDADRLDAIGAIGIARLFATTTEMMRPFYAPEDPLCRRREPNDKAWGIDHFFRKLLKIEAGLHTETARRRAQPRVAMMTAYLEQLSAEIEGR